MAGPTAAIPALFTHALLAVVTGFVQQWKSICTMVPSDSEPKQRFAVDSGHDIPQLLDRVQFLIVERGNEIVNVSHGPEVRSPGEIAGARRAADQLGSQEASCPIEAPPERRRR